MAFSNLSIYYTWKNIKSSQNNNKFKISAPTWNDKLELPDGLYSVSNIPDYFEYILKKHRENIDKPSVQIYVNESTKDKIRQNKNSENGTHLEITEVVLVYCNIVNQ